MTVPIIRNQDHPAKLIQVADVVEDGVLIPGSLKYRIYAVNKCRHCLTVWNRDINAARNILGIFLSLRDKGELPLPFHPHISR